jgi:hypothetical protein
VTPHLGGQCGHVETGERLILCSDVQRSVVPLPPQCPSYFLFRQSGVVAFLTQMGEHDRGELGVKQFDSKLGGGAIR